MKKVNKFYAIAGSNGLGVYSTWDKTKEASYYLSRVRYKKFDNFQDAVSYARDCYNEVSDVYYMGPLPLDFTLYYPAMQTIMSLGFHVNDKIAVIWNADGTYSFAKIKEDINNVESIPIVRFNNP